MGHIVVTLAGVSVMSSQVISDGLEPRRSYRHSDDMPMLLTGSRTPRRESSRTKASTVGEHKWIHSWIRLEPGYAVNLLLVVQSGSWELGGA